MPQRYLDLRIKLQLSVLARLANYKNHRSITNEISTTCELHLPKDSGGFHFVPMTSSLRKNIFKLSDQRVCVRVLYFLFCIEMEFFKGTDETPARPVGNN